MGKEVKAYAGLRIPPACRTASSLFLLPSNLPVPQASVRSVVDRSMARPSEVRGQRSFFLPSTIDGRPSTGPLRRPARNWIT